VEAFDTQLYLAVAIVALSAVVFGWHVVASVRDVRRVTSGPVSHRLLMVLGVAAAAGILYVARQ
jgi:hypothetical protein